MRKLMVESESFPALLPLRREDGTPLLFSRTVSGSEQFIFVGEKEHMLRFVGERSMLIFSAGEIPIFASNETVYCGNRGMVNARCYGMHDIVQEGIVLVCDGLMEYARSLGELIGVISLGVLDPAFNPLAQSHGGLSTRELLYFVKRLRLLKNIKAWAIIDVFPENEKVAAVIVAELL